MSDRLSRTPIAIVGAGCKFPGAPNLDAYRRLLLEGRCALGMLPDDRLDAEKYYDPVVGTYGKSYSRIGGVVEDEPFEAAAYGMSEAESRERLLPELDQIEALRGLPVRQREAIRQTIVDEYHTHHRSYEGPWPPPANDVSRLVSGVFGFTGRQFVVDAACASSLAALDIAVRALQQGRLDLALAGGVSYSSAVSLIFFSHARAISARGSFPFDARADGFISSDGVGMVLLCRLEDALPDWQILGVIRGIGGSCDGSGKGLWAPDKEGQKLALRNAYAGSDVDPADVGYVEAHGTSTALGDATEVEALNEFFGPHLNNGGHIAAGSVKSNIGHCREAAGIAGLIKVLVAFEAETIPPSIGYETPSSRIDWQRTALRIADTSVPWSRGIAPRLAGVDSFGIGGLNYHLIVEETPEATRCRKLLDTAVGHAEKLRHSTREPIAIVGMGCVLPRARGIEGFWKLLGDGTVAIRDVPDDRWPASVDHRLTERLPWRIHRRRAGFVTDFVPDWRRYRIPPRIVERTDPLQFMLLESAMEALADADIRLDEVDRSRVAVAVAVGTTFSSDYGLELVYSILVPQVLGTFERAVEASGATDVDRAVAVEQLGRVMRERLPTLTEDSSGSMASSTLASRISSVLDLQGTTFALDAGEGSSLAAAGSRVRVAMGPRQRRDDLGCR